MEEKEAPRPKKKKEANKRRSAIMVCVCYVPVRGCMNVQVDAEWAARGECEEGRRQRAIARATRERYAAHVLEGLQQDARVAGEHVGLVAPGYEYDMDDEKDEEKDEAQ